MPFCNLFTSHSSFIVFWERDITSEHHGSRSISLLLFRRYIYFPAFTFSCYHYPLCFTLCKTTRPERLTTSLNFVGNKVICVCVQVHISCAADTYLSSPESYWRQTLVSSLRETCCCATSQPSTWGNQRRARSHHYLSRVFSRTL